MGRLHKRAAVAAFAVLFLDVEGPVAAQSASPVGPRIQVGAGVLALGGLLDVSDFVGDPQLGLKGPEVSARVALTPRLALEGRLGVSGVDRVDVDVYDFSVIIKRRRSGQHPTTTFLRFGAAGRREVEDVPEFVHDNQDRSVTVRPAYTHIKVTPPTTALIGAGLQRTVSRHFAIGGGLDVVVGSIGVGMRLSGAISVPVGAYGER